LVPINSHHTPLNRRYCSHASGSFSSVGEARPDKG
jgi:hypothetical protein